MINQPINLPQASMRPGLPPSLDSDEELSQRGGQENKNSSQQAVYLADLNVCYYQQLQRQTVCQEEDVNAEQSQLFRVDQNLLQIKEGFYELQITIQIEKQLIKLTHYFGKSFEVFSNQSHAENKTPTPSNRSKKGQRSRPSCVQKAIQSVNLISCLSPTISPTTIERKDSRTLQGRYDSFSRKASTRINSQNEDLSGEIQSVNQSDLKVSTILSQQEKTNQQNSLEDFEVELENPNLITPISQNQLKKSIDLFSQTAIYTDEQMEKIKLQQSEIQSVARQQNTQAQARAHDNNELQLTKLQYEQTSDHNLESDQMRENIEFESPKFLRGNQNTLSFDISLLQEHSLDNFSPKRNKSNNLVKNILVGFKTSLTNPRSKIYELMDHEVRIIKGDKYSDFKKKLKQFFKKARTNLSDIISIFESNQKRGIFKIFIEKYSKLWLENSPIQDKDNILQFLDFLLLCYQDPNKIKLLSPYRRNKQRNLYRVTDSDKEDDGQEVNIQLKDFKKTSKVDENNFSIEDEESYGEYDKQKNLSPEISRKQVNSKVNKDSKIKKIAKVDQDEKTESFIEEETFEEMQIKDQKIKQRKSSSEKIDNSYEDFSEIQQSHQKSELPSLQRNKLTNYEIIKQ
ncbi:hypothetical protein TTHERM_00301690 (macronuclear) [Tetrahymena thermophila SB210]|uniref:Uncharacterized protein n=1 Tax=Tetrahymena thermophila (strain SB210) TaxID=312017 RepID=I7MM84_TETTS|nr:hypothetical protein TTHERM_00301690 [Tetrahymena thermophila SB210]EAS04352.4 hypothetical protein TTHERM_00301690 [Tetrahymena thermophila SB210]|eukprot:XP_001024597.4 hypothetical protein TTHERM_00301690 [Tetrahymena thermophila SB210]